VPAYTWRWEESARLGRPSATALLSYCLVLVLLVASVAGGVHSPVPVSATPEVGPGVPLPSFALRTVLAAGFPTLGLSRPVPGLSAWIGPRRAAAWAVEALTSLRLGDPMSALATALPALGQAPLRTLRGTWPGLVLATGGGGLSHRRGLLVWGRNPLVAIYETNTRDSFWSEVRLSGKPQAVPVSSDPRRNMVAVAAFLGAALWHQGVPTALSEVVNDADGMIGAYVHSAFVARSLLASFPSLQMLLDVDRFDRPVGVHRGAARIVLVVGTNARLPNPHWRRNLAFARALGAELQTLAPGLLVGIYPSPDSLNQELFPHALTVAIGGPDNTLAQERRAATVLAAAIAALLASGTLPGP
jgi:stage II sporulation protein P